MVTAVTAHSRRSRPIWQQRELTLEEFLALPDTKPALEFEEGQVTQKVSPKGQHSGLQTDLAELFNRFGRRRKLARAFTELRTTFAGRSYVPDVSVYRWERIPLTPDGKVANDFFVPPDITVEIVSPQQSVNALVRRCLQYITHGVPIALLVDPDDESVILFRQGATPLALRGQDGIDLEPVLGGFKLTAAGIFKSLRMN